jgi:hypothetical protein
LLLLLLLLLVKSWWCYSRFDCWVGENDSEEMSESDNNQC